MLHQSNLWIPAVPATPGQPAEYLIAGKSTLARQLARTYGPGPYSTDDAWQYTHEGWSGGNAAAGSST